jgi:hypothetical protein
MSGIKIQIPGQGEILPVQIVFKGKHEDAISWMRSNGHAE